MTMPGCVVSLVCRSLGNMAASESDDGYSKYVPSDWHGYTNACWAANWFRWFQNDTSDARGRMGWPDYFSAALGNAGTVYNYYSSCVHGNGDASWFDGGTFPLADTFMDLAVCKPEHYGRGP